MIQCHDHWVTFSVCACVWMCSCVCMCWSIKQPFGLPLHLPSATFLGLLYTSTLYCSLIWPLHPICFPPSILQINPLSSKHPTLLFLYFSCIPVYSSVIPLYFHFVSPPLLFDSYFLAVVSVIVSVFLVSVYLFNSFRVGGWVGGNDCSWADWV